ncbi:hypothetical protein [Pseudoprimorskyibacter insulae]|nr:hypothetical protein [Pseudoprimorskyibacter insulae]
MLIAAHRKFGPAGLDLTVFAKPAMEPEDAALDGTVLTAKTDAMRDRLAQMGTPDHVDLAEFDAVVFVAMSISVFTGLRIAQAHHVEGWPGRGNAPLAELSSAAYRTSLTALAQDSLPGRMATALQGQINAPIFIVPQPCPAEGILTMPRRFPLFARLANDGNGPALLADLRAGLEAAFAGVHLLHQPEDTIAHGFLTRQRFSRGAVRLNVDASLPPDDFVHANAGYGRVVLERITPQIS